LERKEESPILQVAVSLKGLAKVGKVNCERYRQLCSQAGITGYPTIRYQRTITKILIYPKWYC
jgi:hypothetical protein